MTDRLVRKVFASMLLLVALAACGGGGGGVDSGGTGGTGISSGAITDFGSIFVNGVEFSTNGSTISRDDSPVTEAELRRGMIVEVRGNILNSTSGTAATVNVEETVRGPVEEAPTGTASAGTIIVLGQTVQVDDTTIIDNNVPNFDAIGAGMLLEVHGFRRADGSIAASFIEQKFGSVVFAVRGVAAGHSASAQNFTIGALTIDYRGAVIGDMPAPSGNNWNDLFVEVKGLTCAGNPVCGTLNANKVEPEGLGVANANQAEVEGFVTALVSTSDFTLNSQRVLTNGSTIFLGGLQSEIVVGVKLEVEGSLSGGVLTARKVKFRESVKLESNATVTGSAITLEGLPGITVIANAFTEFDKTSATPTNLSPLNGRNVRIRGRSSGTASVIATEIEDRGQIDSTADVILQGTVIGSDVTNPTFKILGVTVDTSLLDPNSDFSNANDDPISPAAFFSALAPNGGLVKAKGTLPAGPGGNVLAAGTLQEVELED